MRNQLEAIDRISDQAIITMLSGAAVIATLSAALVLLEQFK